MLKEHLGIEEKTPQAVALEDRALELYRLPRRRRQPGQRGGVPAGRQRHKEIGEELDRSAKG